MKNLRALAVAALSLTATSLTLAQSSVTFYGVLDAMVGRFGGASTGVNANDIVVKRLDAGGMSFSRLGFTGSEDLGGGYTATFDLSTFIRNDTGASGRTDAIGAPLNLGADPFWARSSWVGLTNRDLGRIRLGNATSLLFLNAISANAFGDSTVFSPMNLVTFVGGPLSGGTSWNNQVVYNTPNISGFSLWAAITAAEGQGKRNTALRATYSNGPINLSWAWQNVGKIPQTFADGTALNRSGSWQAVGSYDFGPVKLYGHLGAITNKGTASAPLSIDYKVAGLSAQMNLGDGKVLLGYAQRKTSDAVAAVPAAAPAGNKERSVVSFGYDYNLSKRTDVYAVVTRDATTTFTLPGVLVKANATNLGVGVRHTF